MESTQGQIQPDTGYDVLQRPTDWQKGYATFFVGTRLESIPSGDFLPRLTRHVLRVRETFGKAGLQGYIVVATPDYEVAFMNWDSPAAAERAMASQGGQAVVAEAQGLMKPYQFTGAVSFQGRIQPGQMVNVKFPRRPPNQD